MKLLEYEAKHILAEFNLPIPNGIVIERKTIPDNLTLPIVLKSQVPVGGRGKAGGIKVVSAQDTLAPTVNDIFTLSIKGHTPKKLLAEEVIDIDRELYLSLLINRATASIDVMAHKNGGVEVEENDTNSFFTASLTPETIGSVGESLAEYYDLAEKSFLLQDLLKNLLICFTKSDATLIEVNPLILTKQGNIVAGDCKMELDDAALFRHKEWDFEDKPHDANFVTLNTHGTVATIANGAGLAMATVDAVASYGLKPSNFLDIGGGANTEQILTAFNRIIEYPNVQAIVINIFAGITRCDEVARAIIAAKQQINTLPPLFIRLAGTNFEEAVTLLTQENIPTLATLEECLEAAKEAHNG